MGKGIATQEQLNNPMHGVKLIQILEYLVEEIGWEEMAQEVNINCFKSRPSIKSSLRFLRRTEWARKKVEDLYLELIIPQYDNSVDVLWKSFQEENSEYSNQTFNDSFHFCDNKEDADECAILVQKGIKQATSTSLWWFQKEESEIPEIGALYVITDWEGKAKAIVKTLKVEQVAFKDIDESYAKIEGEGDKSLNHWKKVHWDYYTREMNEFEEHPSEDMIIVCEIFETLFPKLKSE